MNEVIVKEGIKIEDLIYEIRGKQVMLDSDLVRLYKCKNGTKIVNLAVKDISIDFQRDLCLELLVKKVKLFGFKLKPKKEN